MICLLVLTTGGLFAQPTKLVVRARAKDGKFIGTNIGGALVVVRDHGTSEVLAKGFTEGQSGNTKLLMETPHERNDRLTDDKTAKFEASIDIKEPLFVDVQVTAPAQLRGAAITGTTQLWLIPGKDIDGDGVIIELPGFNITVLNPTLHQILPIKDGETINVDLSISLTMLCGCSINKNGVWKSDQIEVGATLTKDGKPIATKLLSLTEKDNIFNARFSVNSKGSYGFTIYAYDKVTKNTGAEHGYFFVN
jgi:hypothetical protein